MKSCQKDLWNHLAALNRPNRVDSVPIVLGVIDQWPNEGNLVADERNRDRGLVSGNELQHQPTVLAVDISNVEQPPILWTKANIDSPVAVVLEIDGFYYSTPRLAVGDDSQAERI